MKIKLDVFQKEILVIKGSYDSVIKRYPWVEDAEVGNALGLTFWEIVEDKLRLYVWIRAKQPEMLNTIAHEAMHLTNRIFQSIGYDSEYGNEEPQAWVVGYLTQEIAKAYGVGK